MLELKEMEALTCHVSRRSGIVAGGGGVGGGGCGYDGADLTPDDLDEAFDGDLTFVGLVMADIPLDVHLTKLILMGHVFGLLEEAIIIACALNQQSLFVREFAYRKQLRVSVWGGEGRSGDERRRKQKEDLAQHTVERVNNRIQNHFLLIII